MSRYNYHFAITSQLIPLHRTLMSGIPLFQPGLHLPNLPLMRRLDEIRLGTNIQYPHTVPMMSSARDQQLILAVSCTRVFAVVTHVSPDVTCSVDECQSRRRDIEVAILVVPA